jgi:catechol 2,3-dioxygenase-like lactoylglutathione lyase family enzyme
VNDHVLGRLPGKRGIGRGSLLARHLSIIEKEGDCMLSDKDAIATVAVKNLETAKKFYEGTLGLTKVLENEEVLAFKTGKSTLFVYRSQYAGTNKATAVTFVAEEVDDLVRTLKGRGVTFEHYDLPQMTRQGDVHAAGSMRAAWFKDPDGNIFSVVTPSNTAGRQAETASARSTT